MKHTLSNARTPSSRHRCACCSTLSPHSRIPGSPSPPWAHFTDPAFPDLRGAAVGEMWTMLCQQAKDFRLEFRDVKADDSSGAAHWEAWYLFGGKRPVHNVIEARFSFADGRITRHADQFDFWRWSRQALGPAGLLLRWTPLLRGAVVKRAGASLAAWQKRR